jgi:hypothetical protein
MDEKRRIEEMQMQLKMKELELDFAPSKFNYLYRSNNSDLLVPQAPLFESDINYSAENSILIE